MFRIHAIYGVTRFVGNHRSKFEDCRSISHVGNFRCKVLPSSCCAFHTTFGVGCRNSTVGKVPPHLITIEAV